MPCEARLQPLDPQASAALAWVERLAEHGAAGEPPSAPTAEAWARLTPAELRSHLDRALTARHVELALDAWLELGVFDAWLPEVKALVGFGEGPVKHKDVWRHTRQVVRQSVPRLAVRWAALLHDIGKVATRRFGAGGQVTFHGHAERGALVFENEIAPRLELEAPLARRVRALILHHQRPAAYEPSWSDAAVRRFARDMREWRTDLLDLSRADLTTGHRERRRRALAEISELAARIRQLAEEDARPPPLPRGIGAAIMKGFGLAPGPRVGQLKAMLEAAIAGGELPAGHDEAYYLDWLSSRAGSTSRA